MITASVSLIVAAALTPSALAATQPANAGTGAGTFEIVGETGVSAQQLWLGTDQKVYVIDKVQNNHAQVNGHAAWATEYDLTTNTYRTMDVVTNSFCAGGGVLGDGNLLNVGGNQAVIPGGDSLNSSMPNTYQNEDGGQAIRLLKPCNDDSCNFVNSTMATRRWYPTVETLGDGTAAVIGGNLYGGFVNDDGNNNPTWEVYPDTNGRGVMPLNILKTTLPANLYPLTWLMPSGKLFIQTNLGAELFDPVTQEEDTLPDVPHAVRTYPASAATVLLPLTPANNYTATALFCGGSDLQPNQWKAGLDLTQVAASSSCVKMSPDVDRTWVEDDDLPDGRTMGNFILLPTGKVFLANGANTGVAGYGTESWTKGDSYADDPIFQPYIYDPDAAEGSKFSMAGLSKSTIPRMYHSVATLLPDGAVFIAGSSPHPDVVLDNTPYPTEYRVEKFYPDYYSKTRPEPKGLVESLSYGGDQWDVQLTKADIPNGATSLEKTKVVVIRTGFSTHAVNFGQRFLQLENTYTLADDGSATLHIAQMPPNSNTFAPGPAWLYVVVDGVPSIGVSVMVGSGKIETQKLLAATVLPEKSVPAGTTIPDVSDDSSSSSSDNSARSSQLMNMNVLLGAVVFGVMFMFGL